MTLEQKIKEIEGLLGNVGILMSITDNDKAHMFRKSLEQALEVIRELQAENTALKARLQPTPEAPEIDKITCLEADIALRDDRIKELEKQLDRVRDTEKLQAILRDEGYFYADDDISTAQALQNFILGGEGGK